MLGMIIRNPVILMVRIDQDLARSVPPVTRGAAGEPAQRSQRILTQS